MRRLLETLPQMAQPLEGSGALSHLGDATRARVDALIHDAADPNSFAGISSELERALAVLPTAGSMFPPKFRAWLARLNDVVRDDSASQMMSAAQFSDHAAQAVAMSLVLERAAPGSLALIRWWSFGSANSSRSTSSGPTGVSRSRPDR